MARAASRVVVAWAGGDHRLAVLAPVGCARIGWLGGYGQSCGLGAALQLYIRLESRDAGAWGPRGGAGC